MRGHFSRNFDIYICLALFGIRLISSFYESAISGTTVMATADTTWWYGAFHHFVASTIHGVLPYWNPYSHGGEPFYFLYSMYRFLDPTILYPLLMAKFTSIDLMLIYHQYYMVREFVLFGGLYMLARLFVKEKRVCLLYGLLAVYTYKSTSQFSMHKIDSLSWTPWICYFFIRSYWFQSRIDLLAAAFFTGILIGPSCYHFLYFIVFCALMLLVLVALDQTRFLQFVKAQRWWLCLSGILVGIMSLPLLAAFMDQDSIFPIARVFGGRDEFMRNFFSTAKLSSSYDTVFRSGGDHMGAFLSLRGVFDEFAYFGRSLQDVCIFFATLGFISLSHRAKAGMVFVMLVITLCAMAGSTPFYYILFKNIPILQMIRHTVGYSYMLDLFKFPLLALGFAYLLNHLNEGSAKRRLTTVAGALVVTLIVGFMLRILNWKFAALILLMPAGFIPSIKMRNYAYYFLIGIGFVWSFNLSFNSRFMNMVPREEVVHNLTRVFPDKFTATQPAYDPRRVFSIPRPGWLLFEAPILQRDVALSTVLEPPKGKTNDDIPYLKHWAHPAVGNRTIYWPIGYLQPYLLGEENIYAFFDIFGTERDKVRFFTQAQTLKANVDETILLFKNTSRSDYRVTDRALLLQKAELAAVNGDQLKSQVSSLANVTSTFTSHVISFDTNSIRMRIRTPESGYLLYNDMMDKHWRAYVNGVEQSLLTANLAFKALTVSAGESTVEFRYRPQFFVNTVWLYLVCALIGFAALLGAAIFRFNARSVP